MTYGVRVSAPGWRAVFRRRWALSFISVLALASGCGVLNPAFVSFAAPDGAVTTTKTPTGFVPIFFISNAQFDTPILQYLAARGADISDPNLRPRIRVRASVTFADDSTRTLEFLDGSQITEPSNVNTSGVAVPVDLTRPVLTNQVLPCDVRQISIAPTSVEVYVPVSITQFRYEQVQGIGNVLVRDQIFAPQFVALQVDEVDTNLNTLVFRNLGIRDTPAPLANVTCGSVGLFALEGTLSVPFVNGIPGWVDTDTAQTAAFPGRFRVVTTVR
jgi:hypothetical protein